VLALKLEALHAQELCMIPNYEQIHLCAGYSICLTMQKMGFDDLLRRS